MNPDILRQLIAQALNLPYATRQVLMQAVEGMSPAEQVELGRVLRTGLNMGIGAAASTFFTGGLMTPLPAIAGAMVGGMLLAGPPRLSNYGPTASHLSL